MLNEDELHSYCTIHWLSSLYDDFLAERTAGFGGRMPCSTCPYFGECKSSPPVNFALFMDRVLSPQEKNFQPKWGRASTDNR